MSVSRSVWTRSVLGTVFAGSLAACATAASTTGPLPAAHVVALSTYSAPIGDPIEVYGTNFPDPSEGYVMLAFKGNFYTSDGRTIPVDTGLMRAGPKYDSRHRVVPGAVVWRSFGPFFNPLTTRDPNVAPEAAIGRFEGRVHAHVVATPARGAPSDQINGTPDNEGTPVTFEVQPSIVVTELQPIGASCGAPAKVGLSLFPYQVSVKALGFTPVTIAYSMETPPTEWDGPTHKVNVMHLIPPGQTEDTAGQRSEFTMPGVPVDRTAYDAIFRIEATSTDGKVYRTFFSFGVHRPIELIASQTPACVRENRAPVQISGCIAAGPTGAMATYEDSMTEMRMRSVDTHFSMGMSQGLTFGQTNSSTNTSEQSYTFGRTEERGMTETVSNSVALAQTQGGSFSWTYGESSEKIKVRGTTKGTGTNQSNGTSTDQNESSNWMGSGGVNLGVVSLGGGGGHMWGSSSGENMMKGSTTDTTEYFMDTDQSGTNMMQTREMNFSNTVTNTNEHSIANTRSLSLNESETRSISRAEMQSYEMSRMSMVNQEMSQGTSVTDSKSYTMGMNRMIRLPANSVGVWYRQETRLVYTADVVAYTLCGDQGRIGRLEREDWQWNIELAVSELRSTCDTLPLPRQLASVGTVEGCN